MERGSQVHISRAVETHFAEMADLMGLLFLQDGNALPDRQIQVKALKLLTDNPHYGRALCATLDGKVIAVCTLHYMISTALAELICRVEDVVVDPETRNRGVGRKLMRFAIEQARADGCKRMLLDIKTNNAGARTLYEALEFEVEDELVMTRKL